MNAEMLSHILIESFSGYSTKQALELSKDGSIVQYRIFEKYGEDVLREVLKLSVRVWRDAWLLFEKHHGVFTHGDLMDKVG
jgi:hypothetical protein